MTSNPQSQIIDAAITSRRSVRQFLPKPVPLSTVGEILSVAARAPSGTNMQPWKVHVLTGEALANLSKVVLAAFRDPKFPREQAYKYYPDKFPEPYLARRRKVGWDMYGLLGIEKGDGEKMMAQHGRNFEFFDAPVGLIFTIDEVLEIGSWLDYGMFWQNIMIAARGRDLDTCPQAAFAQFHKVIRAELNIPDDQVVVGGMALGWADETATINQLETERAELDEFVTFHAD